MFQKSVFVLTVLASFLAGYIAGARPTPQNEQGSNSVRMAIPEGCTCNVEYIAYDGKSNLRVTFEDGELRE